MTGGLGVVIEIILCAGSLVFLYHIPRSSIRLPMRQDRTDTAFRRMTYEPELVLFGERLMSLLAVRLIFVSSLMSSLALAQPNNPYGNQGPPRIAIDGKLKAWQGGTMQVVGPTGQAFVFALPQNPNGIIFSAPVDKAALKKGMMVRIQAPVGPNGQFLDPVRTLTIFVPDPTKSSSQSSLNDRTMNVPGVYRMNDIYHPKLGEAGSPDVRIVGAIIGIEQNVLGLNCGNGPMKIELDANPLIEMITSSLDYARPGDPVTGSAYMNPSTDQLVASSVMIKGVKAITADAPPPTAAPTSKLRVKEKTPSNSKKPSLKGKPEMVEKPAEPTPPSDEKPDPK